MVEFSQLHPTRYVDCGIAEQHAVTMAAGLACEGMKPVVAIYSTFLQRGYDQLIHDVALQNLPVVFALDRAGIVGADGATHAGVFDIPYLRCVPNMAIACPSDENECRQLLTVAYAQQTYDQLVNSPKRELKIFTTREGGVEHVGADNMSFGRDYIADWFAEALGGHTA